MLSTFRSQLSTFDQAVHLTRDPLAPDAQLSWHFCNRHHAFVNLFHLSQSSFIILRHHQRTLELFEFGTGTQVKIQLPKGVFDRFRVECAVREGQIALTAKVGLCVVNTQDPNDRIVTEVKHPGGSLLLCLCGSGFLTMTDESTFYLVMFGTLEAKKVKFGYPEPIVKI